MNSRAADETMELDALRKQYPLGLLDLDTRDGRRWNRRMEESENYFKRYSRQWEVNRALLCDFTKMIEAFGTYVAIAYPIIDNFIADMYYRNPKAYLQDKDGDRDMGRIVTDVINSVHQECDSEREMRDAFQDQTWAGLGVIAGSFMQKPANAGEPIMEDGEPDEFGRSEPRDSGEIVEPTEQKVLIQRLSPWRNRFDPKGRRWDMSDHRYWAYDSFEYLGPLMRDPRLSNDDKARLIAYYGKGGAAFSADAPEEGESSISGASETDPEFIRVCMRTIWSRPDHTVYRMPYGASFTFTPQPWDEEWARVDMFPIRYMPRKRIPEDQKNTEGFIALPDLTLIRPHIENINKMQGLLVRGLEHVLDVYVTVKGALEGVAAGKMEQAGRMFSVIQFDPDALKKFPSMQETNTLKVSDIMHLLPTGDTEDMQHMAAIDHEFSLIAQIMGQGPADRGGVQPAATATESLGEQQGIARRMSSNRNDGGKHYNAVTRIIFIIIQARHTLPLRYQQTTAFNQKVWSTFVDPVGVLKNVDLHFDYATGSTEARTRDQEFALRERMANILMPVFQAQQNWRMVMKVAEELIEPLDILNAEQFFSDQARELVTQLLTILRGLGNGAIAGEELTADNAAVIQQIPELIAQLAQVILTPDQLAQVEAIVQGAQEPEGGGGGTGSLQKPPTPGEASAAAGAAGSAAAGSVGGMAAHQPMGTLPS